MCVATDKTWTRIGERWMGKCIHCNRKITLSLDGVSEGGATLEHIVPRHHGGNNHLDNLSIACGRCNHQKGRKLDILKRDDPRLMKVIERLKSVKAARLRPPVQALAYLFNTDGVY